MRASRRRTPGRHIGLESRAIVGYKGRVAEAGDGAQVRDRVQIWICLALLLSVALVYAQVRGHRFVAYDDREAVYANPGLRQGLSVPGVFWAFRTLLVANWIPLTVLSLLADQQIHGLQARFVLLENAALHALASVLLFRAFSRMTRAPWRSAAVAAVFALHPLHVESVAWAAMRKDTLSGVFFALTLLAHVRYVERPDARRLAGVSLAFAAGLLCKPSVVTLPFVLLLLDFWPLGRLSRPDGSLDLRRLRALGLEKLPLFVLASVASATSIWAQRSSAAMVALGSFPLASRIVNALAAYWGYLRASLWPSGLAAFYPAPVAALPVAAACAGALVLAGVSLVAWRERARRPWILVGWLWFVGMLVPMIGLVQVGQQARADRYTYLPLIGLSILPIWAAGELASRMPPLRVALAAMGVAILLAFGGVSHHQVGFWRDGVTLFRRVLAVTEDNAEARDELAYALMEQGRPAEAIEQLRAGLRMRPDFVDMKNNLAWILVTHPELPPATADEALLLATEAVRATGGADPRPLYTLSLALARAGRFDDAIQAGLRAAERARATRRPALAAEIELRVAGYRARRVD